MKKNPQKNVFVQLVLLTENNFSKTNSSTSGIVIPILKTDDIQSTVRPRETVTEI